MIPEEYELIVKLHKGEEKAFEKIYSLFHRQIYKFCLNLHKSDEEARETVQKVFVALWEQRRQVDENKPLATYLFSIAKYMIYQDFRKEVYKKAAFDHIINNSNYTTDSTKDEVLFNELLSFLESLIERLPERQREIFKLSRLKGLTYRQIAGQLNITENTVDTQIRRALEFVRNKYNSHYR